MELAKTLVRSVVRAFYETRHIPIIDALVIHSALRDDDLAYLMGVNIKELHKTCQKLKDDRLLASHARLELREGQSRPNSRTYYYIDYRQTIDAIKWRVYKIDKDLQGPMLPASEKKQYFCDHCKAEYTLMEVINSAVGPDGLLCQRCGSTLKSDERGESGGHERSTRMNSQFKFITDLLPKIDSVVIPDNSFDVAFTNKRPIVRDATHQTAASVGVDPADGSHRPTAVRGLMNTGPSTLSVSIQAGNGPSQEELADERAHRERVAQQNALPSWMSNSTITGEAFKTEATARVQEAADSDRDVKDLMFKVGSGTDAHLQEEDDYFLRLKKEAAKEAQKKANGGDDEDDEDVDDDEEGDEEEDMEEFEDVMSASGTPAPTRGGGLSAPPNANPSPSRSVPGGLMSNSSMLKAPSPLRQAHMQSSLKRSSADGDSPSNPGSPSVDRAAKKAKVDDGGAATGESDEDEGLEFEDV